MLRKLRGARLLAAVVAGSLALAAGEARAAIISFSTTSDTEVINMANGNQATVAIAGRTGSIDLTPGVPQTVRLHVATLSGIPASADSGAGSLSHILSITSPASSPTSQTIVQPVTAAYGSFFDPFVAQAMIGPRAAGPVTFNLGAAGTLTVTPEGGSVSDPTFSGPVQFDNNATFLLVPEPVALPLLAGLAVLAVVRRRR
jgi:hypothetical protein